MHIWMFSCGCLSSVINSFQVQACTFQARWWFLHRVWPSMDLCARVILACLYMCVPPIPAQWTAGQLTPQQGWISISNYWHNSACFLTATSLPWGRPCKRHRYHPWDHMTRNESGAERHGELFGFLLTAFINSCFALQNENSKNFFSLLLL